MNHEFDENIVLVRYGAFQPDGGEGEIEYQHALVLDDDLVDEQSAVEGQFGRPIQKMKIDRESRDSVFAAFKASGPGQYAVTYKRQGKGLVIQAIKALGGKSQGKQA